MFDKATSKLSDAQIAFDKLKGSSDAQEFKAMFSAFLNSGRAVTNALQKDGKNVVGFSSWYEKKQEEMKNDKLLKFVHDARTADFHEGSHGLASSTHIRSLNTGKLGLPSEAGADLLIRSDGIYWVVGKDTPKERLVPVREGGDFSTQLSLTNAPTEHIGKKLGKNDPISICTLALDYYENLVYEAKSKFTGNTESR
jgi:hypothetical protein